jgi:DNA polymerase I
MKKLDRETLFLIDGMAIAYRSYFAFIQRPLINSKGENTSAIYGFVTFLNKILDDECPDHIAVVFDTAAPTFRHTAYPPYKATRDKMPDDMSSQIDTLKAVVRAYNVPVIELDGYEADDVIGTLARRAERENIPTYLVTSDKDFMQLVSEVIKIYRPGRQGNEVEVLGIDKVKEKFGVSPDKVIDVLGLIGDSSDNVPGVKGIGEKTAIPLIQQFGTLEQLLEKLESIPQKGVRERLKNDAKNALLSKQLVTIDTNVPLALDFHTLRYAGKDIPALSALFERLEFRSLLKRLQDEAPGGSARQSAPAEPAAATPTRSITSTGHTYTLVRTVEDLKTLSHRLSHAQAFAFDTETTSTDPLRCELVGLSFAVKAHEAFFVPVHHPLSDLKAEVVLDLLRPPLQDRSIAKVGQNIKFDTLVLSQAGIAVEGSAFDTMIASYLLRADGQHNLDALAAEYLGYSTITYDDLTGTGRERKELRQIELERIADYACEDADVTLQLWSVLGERLAQESLTDLYDTVEHPLIGVLTRMELSGVSIDGHFLGEMSKELERTLDGLSREITRLAGVDFNINSTQQLGEVLFTRLGLPTVRKTKTGFSTDVAVLEQLREAHPIVESLLNYRQLVKLKSTYVDALPELVNPRTGRVHTSYNQTIAATGRLSSSNPNLQNIPIRTDIGRSIRTAFVPGAKDRLIMSADYSQIELRVMAHMSGDEGLRQAFEQREDVHASTASKVFGVSAAQVTKEMRRKAKEVNFGIMYGIGPFGLAQRLGITQTEAKEIIDRYFARFPKVKQYIGDTIAFARQNGYVSTLLGRRRYFPEIGSRNHNVRQNAERQAINMPIQGTSADMIKLAMIAIDRDVAAQKLKSLMLMQVHDELVFEVWKGELEHMTQLVKDRMSTALKLSVPLDVEVGSGKNWLEAG